MVKNSQESIESYELDTLTHGNIQVLENIIKDNGCGVSDCDVCPIYSIKNTLNCDDEVGIAKKLLNRYNLHLQGRTDEGIELLEYLGKIMEEQDLRFGQLIYNLGIDFDKEYNMENGEMLELIKSKI